MQASGSKRESVRLTRVDPISAADITEDEFEALMEALSPEEEGELRAAILEVGEPLR